MKRLSIPIALLIFLGGLFVFANTHQQDSPTGLSFESFFRLAGQPVKTLDRSITRVLGVNAKDERELGDVLANYLSLQQVPHMELEKAYVNAIANELSKQYNPKQLNYRIYIMEGPANAFAVAGGNIVITTGMLAQLKSEAQLVAILGHEKGHVDLGHCIDHMRIQAKTYNSSVGKFLDWYLSIMLNHTFSKFQENEADRFGFETLVALKYDPSALGDAFKLMLTSMHDEKNHGLSNPIEDYFKTHPSLSIRAENWNEKAHRWKLQNPRERYYVGVKNYADKINRESSLFPAEWHQGE